MGCSRPVESSVLRKGRSTWRGATRRWALAALVATDVLVVSSAWAASTDRARERATQAVSEVEAAASRLSTQARPAHRHDPTKMVTDGELHLRTKQYSAAIDELSKVIELRAQGKASEAVEADAHFLLGQAYFATGELYSARRHFEKVTDHAEDPSYAGLGGRAASRLVDIALQAQRLETLPDVLARVDRMLARSTTDALLYARAKALFAMGRYDEARAQSEKVTGPTLYAQRASYLRGTALMKEAQAKVPADVPNATPDFKTAIAAFEQATVPAKDEGDETGDAQRITALSWLAIGRLQYEANRDTSAITAYQKVSRTSEYFSIALFELAWAYVRLGDYERAQRSLEALTILDPGLIDGADAELLRADLLLRSGKFALAQEAYEAARKKYEPLREQVRDFVLAHEDPAIYYDKLTAADIEIGHELPSLAIDWAREEATEERVFAIVDDVARSRSLIKRSRRIVTLLRASLTSESRSKVFPELQQELEDVVGLLNQLGLARLTLARAMDEVAGDGSGELSQVRAQRRTLMKRLGQVPANPGDFTVRVTRTEESWNKVSQSLQRLQLEADHLRALVNGLQRMVQDAEYYGVAADAASLERFKAEIEENKQDLALYLKRIEELRDQVEMGRVQSGFGDEFYVEDDRVRNEFARLFAQEVSLAARAGGKEASYAASLSPLLARIATIEGRLAGQRGQLESQSKDRADEVLQVVNTEAEAIDVYASRLDTMDQHARLLVGEVARSNLMRVGDRIKDVVMRADIGLVQQAWEVREEQRYRVRDLLRERAQEERLINDELREVLDDASEESQ